MTSTARSVVACSHRFDQALRPFRLLRQFGFFLSLLAPSLMARTMSAQTIHVDITTDHSTNTFIPNQALGAGIDRMNAVAIDKLFTEDALNRVLSAGWQTVSYRQNTELHIEDWHWNP